MLLNRILQTHKECFACTFSNSWTAHYNKNFFEHFGCLTQCLYSLMFKYQTAWLLMEILISVEHSGCSKCLQFFARLFVSTENRKFNVAIAERVHGAGVVRSCEQSSSMTFFRQCWLMEPKQKGIMALFNHSTVKVELKKITTVYVMKKEDSSETICRTDVVLSTVPFIYRIIEYFDCHSKQSMLHRVTD